MKQIKHHCILKMICIAITAAILIGGGAFIQYTSAEAQNPLTSNETSGLTALSDADNITNSESQSADSGTSTELNTGNQTDDESDEDLPDSHTSSDTENDDNSTVPDTMPEVEQPADMEDEKGAGLGSETKLNCSEQELEDIFGGIVPVRISTYQQFKDALQTAQAEGWPSVRLEILEDIFASDLGGSSSNPTTSNGTAVIGGTGTASALSMDIEIYSSCQKRVTIDMDRYQILLGGTKPTLYVHDIDIKSTDTYSTTAANMNYTYGVFQTVDSRSARWTAYFENINYAGSCLVGTNERTKTLKSYFEFVNFSGDNTITVNNCAAQSAVVLAESVTISGDFNMYDDITSTSWGPIERRASTQAFFKSPNTSQNYDHQRLNVEAYGDFRVMGDANVSLYRDSQRSGQGSYTAGYYYYRSLIEGYQNYYFYEGCEFEAAAGTNRDINTGHADTDPGYYPNSGNSTTFLPKYRSAVIYSGDCREFFVGYVPPGDESNGGTTNVTLSTIPPSASSSEVEYAGWTALFLAKQRASSTDLGDPDNPAMSFHVAKDAVLDIRADNRKNNTTIAAIHGCSPVLITGPGSSRTTIEGKLTVSGGRGDAWSYQYNNVDNQWGYQDFHVTKTGTVLLSAYNLNGSQGRAEYAAFDAYGFYETHILVEGYMEVKSSGYRAISLAGSGRFSRADQYVAKTITVKGEDAKLDATGWVWAITAEYASRLRVTATDGGKMYLQSNSGDITNAQYGDEASSTVYSVGTANYEAVNNGEIFLFHNGGGYSAIFHDGYGPLQIDVKSGGKMTVLSANSLLQGQTSNNAVSTNYRARRAAICAQSTVSSRGYYSSNDNYIDVDGEGSSLNVYNNNDQVHGDAYEYLYPMGAISFNTASSNTAVDPTLANDTNSAGRIRVSNGASFEAISESRTPTIMIHNGTVTFDNPGYFHIRNNSLTSSADNVPDHTGYGRGTGDKEGRALYNFGRMTRELYTGQPNYIASSKFGPSKSLTVKFVNCDVSVWSQYENSDGYADYMMDNSWNNVSFDAGNDLGVYAKPKDAAGNIVSGSGPASSGQGTVYNGHELAPDEFHLSSYGRINGRGGSYSAGFHKYDESGRPLADAEFVIWRYVQEYIESEIDPVTGEYIPPYYRDTEEKEYFFYDTASNSVSWVHENDAADGFENVTKIVTTDEGDGYNGILDPKLCGGLSYGYTYHLKEIKAPVQYDVLDEDFPFIWKPQGGAYLITDPIYNRLKADPLGSIKIVKYGDQDTEALSGAEFTIEVKTITGDFAYIYYDDVDECWKETADQTKAGKTTSGDDGVIFEQLPQGTYRITETKAPVTASGDDYMLLKEPIIAVLPYTSIYPAGETPPGGYTDWKTVENQDGSKSYFYYNLTYTVTDTMAVKLPDAGHPVFFGWYAVIGVAFLAISGMTLFCYRRLKCQEGERK